MRRTWFVIGGAIAAAVLSYSIYINGEAINDALNNQSAVTGLLVVINIIEGVFGIALPYYQWWADKKEKKRSEYQNLLDAHKRKIIEKYESENAYGFDPLLSINSFSFKKELLQHLFTGYDVLFAQIGQALTDDDNWHMANDDMHNYAKSIIARVAHERNITLTIGSSNASYSDVSAQQLVNLVAEGKNEFYVLEYEVVRNDNDSRVLCARIFDNELANDFVTALNMMSKDPLLIEKYNTTKGYFDKKVKTVKKCLADLKDLFNSIDLGATNLNGICHSCIDMPGLKNKPILAEKLKEFDKVEWVQEWLKT